MNTRHLLLCAVVAALPALAAAQEAHALKRVNVRAGPARDYPLVATFGFGAPLAVQGCSDGYGWCDVIGPDDVRGWVYAGNIGYPYQSAEVPLLGYGPMIGLPIVTFSIGSYWNSYYPSRPWFRDRGRWENHRPPPRPMVRPSPLPGPPVMRPPGGPHLPFGRPPGDNRPPPVMSTPPAPRAPPMSRPSGGPRPEPARPPGGGGRPPSGDNRRGEGPRQLER